MSNTVLLSIAFAVSLTFNAALAYCVIVLRADNEHYRDSEQRWTRSGFRERP